MPTRKGTCAKLQQTPLKPAFEETCFEKFNVQDCSIWIAGQPPMVDSLPQVSGILRNSVKTLCLQHHPAVKSRPVVAEPGPVPETDLRQANSYYGGHAE
jgi:hypothetical protein